MAENDAKDEHQDGAQKGTSRVSAKAKNSSSTSGWEWILPLALLVMFILGLVVAKLGASGPSVYYYVVPVSQGATSAPVRNEPSPTATAGQTTVSQTTAEEWKTYDDAGGIPYNGTTWNVDVAPDELEVFTGGPMCIFGHCLPGGKDRGSVIVFLPAADRVVRYEVTRVLPGSNWHGSYRPLDPLAQATWLALANNRVTAMGAAPNCTPGTGCLVVDVLIVGPDGVIDQWTVGG